MVKRKAAKKRAAKKAPADTTPPRTGKHPGGRPTFKPTAEQSKTVQAMVAYGVPLEEVAKVIGIDRKTLSKHFKFEIETAAIMANAKVAESLYKKAIAPDLVGPSVTAAIFWLKTKAGWKETTTHEHTGKDGAPIPFSNLSDEDLDARIATLLAASTSVADDTPSDT